MTLLIVYFPWPDSRLSPNARIGWKLRARLTKAVRERAARIAADHGLNPVRSGIPVSVVFRPPSARWDDDNIRAMGKATLDGLADAMGANDRDFHPDVVIGDPIKGGAIAVMIEGIPAD